MKRIIAVFPGQGSQSVGMGKELLSEFPQSKLIFEEAEDEIHLPIRKLCLESSADDLALTENQQPCILALSLAMWSVLRKESDVAATFFAGHSLGEYSALAASGKLGLAKAVSLVRERGKAMQEAVPVGIGAMAAVIGYNADSLIHSCKEIAAKLKCCIEVVNFNSPVQQIISGDRKGVMEVCSYLEKERVRTVLLPVSAPFHSSLMAPARKHMQPLLEKLTFADAKENIIANVSGNLEKEYMPQHLIDQIDHPVLWTRTMATAQASGSEVYLEVGPGKVLSGLAKRCLPKGSRIIPTDTKVSDAIRLLNEASH